MSILTRLETGGRALEARLRTPAWGRWFWPTCLIVLVLRLWFCALMPKNTTDVIRNLVYGNLVWHDGLAVLGTSLKDLPYPYPAGTAWPELPYNYPIVTLGFFALVAGAWPTMFLARLALTAVEVANTWLVWRLTGRRWMALVYWVAPISIWWVSREGQFEPLQNLFVLGSLWLLARRRPAAALAVLMLAVQVKLTAAALLPWMLVEAARRGRRTLAVGLAGLAVALAPTVVAGLYYPAWTPAFHYSTPLHYNPYYWNVFYPGIFGWNPWWLVELNTLASGATLGVLVVAAWRARDRWPYLAPIAFVLFVKMHSNVQFWYWLIWPTLVLPIAEPRVRRWLWVLYPLLDLSAVIRLVAYQFGNHLDHYLFVNTTAFTPMTVLLSGGPPGG